MSLPFSMRKLVEVQDWDSLVSKTYGKPYNFQQQEGCKLRGVHHLTIPGEAYDFENDLVPEVINGAEMGVNFDAWKRRDPTAPVGDRTDQWAIDLFWSRNFYPDVQTLANDLHARGEVEAGDYIINIDW